MLSGARLFHCHIKVPFWDVHVHFDSAGSRKMGGAVRVLHLLCSIFIVNSRITVPLAVHVYSISSACIRSLYESSSGMLLRFLRSCISIVFGSWHEDLGQGLLQLLVRGSCREILVKSSQGSLQWSCTGPYSCGDPRAMRSEAFAWSCTGPCGKTGDML